MPVEFIDSQIDFEEPNNTSWYDFYKEFIPLEPQNETGKYKVHCVLHDDTHASAFVDTSTSVYYCSVCGSFTPYRFLVEGLDFDPAEAQAKESVYKQSNINEKKIKHVALKKGTQAPKDGYGPKVEQAQAALSPDNEHVTAYIESRGIEYQTLLDFGIGFLPEDENQKVACLIFPYFLNKRVYTVKGRSLDGRKGAIDGASLIPYNVDSLLKAKIGVIVEGETDCLITYQALKETRPEVGVVGIPGAASFKPEWARYFQHLEEIVIIPQADRAGGKLVEAVRNIFPEKTTVRELTWSFYDFGKDIADWLRFHSIDELLQLIPNLSPNRMPYLSTIQDFVAQAGRDMDWIIPGLLAKGQKGIIYGQPKTYKTFVMLNLVKAITRQEPFLEIPDWKPAVRSKVLFVEEEGNPIMFGRRIRELFSEPDSDNFVRFIFKKSVMLQDATSLNKLREAIEDHEPNLIIFDPFGSLFFSDENDTKEMGRFWHDFNREIAFPYPDSAQFFIHHIPKYVNVDEPLNLYNIRGSSTIAAQIDLGMGLRLGDENRQDGIELLMNIQGRDYTNPNKGELVILAKPQFGMSMEHDGWRLTDSNSAFENAKTKVAECLAKEEEALTAAEIEAKTGVSSYFVKKALGHFLAEDEITTELGESQGGRPAKVFKIKEAP